MAYITEDILNLALVGPAGSGKTQLTEALAHAAGEIPNMGLVTAGTTISDYDEREKAAKHSLSPTVVSFEYESKHLNIVDTPGFADFLGRTLAVLPAVETAVVVVDAASGLDANAQKLLKIASDRRLCRMIVVNKIDSPDADLESLLESIQNSVGSECLPINLPGSGRNSVVDCFFGVNGDATDFDSVESAHEKIIDQVVEVDDDLMELYLEEPDNLPSDQLHNAFETALREGHLIPVCFTSATTGVGVKEFLTIGKKLLPNPTEGNPIPFSVSTEDGVEEFIPDQDASNQLLAHTFKVTIDPFRGRLAVMRLHQGSLNVGGQMYVDDDRKPRKIQHLLRLTGSKQTEIDKVIAGDIFAFPRADGVEYNSVVHDSRDSHSLSIRAIDIPTPVFGKAIRAETDTDAQKISDAMHNMAAEDPSLHVDHVASLNETVLRGFGELHLREVLERISEQYGVTIQTDFPAIAYRETITSKADGHNRHKKQTGGAGQFGEVYMRIEPLPRGEGFEFVDAIVGGVIPGQFIPAVEKGVRQVLQGGAISGHELQDVKVTVYDGKHHPVDSKEIAFVQAGKKAFIDAISKARPIVMEPVVNISVNVPSECMGDVTGDLASMGGIISGSNVRADTTSDIDGQVPLREMQTYHSRLSSVSGGRGTYTMEFSHYAPVQATLQKELVSEFNPVEDD